VTAVLVALGGALGAVLRYWISAALQGSARADAFPSGTLVVNVVGCFAIGASALADRPALLSPGARAFLAAGVLGGFTTFSAFASETVTAARAGAIQISVLNILGSVGLCLVAVWLGRMAATPWAR
jgi:CrcB protein